MSPRNQNLLGVPMDVRLVSYAALAGAALAAPAAADASIVYSGVVNIAIPITSAGVYLNVVTGVNAITPAGAPGWDVNPWGSSGFNLWGATGSGFVINAAGGSSATLVDNLAPLTLISVASTFAQSNSIETTGATAFVLSSSNNIGGFQFVNEAAGGQTQYGWIRISLSTAFNTAPRLVVEYAYENTGAPILAGAIPEPSTLALFGVMAAGAFGVRAWRKRKAV